MEYVFAHSKRKNQKVGEGQGMLRKTNPYNLSDKLISSSPRTHNLICHTSKDWLPQVLSNDSFDHSWTWLFFICINNHPTSVLYLHIRCNLGIWYWYEYWYGRTYQLGMIWGNTSWVWSEAIPASYQYQSGMAPEVIPSTYLPYNTINIRFIPFVYQAKISLGPSSFLGAKYLVTKKNPVWFIQKFLVKKLHQSHQIWGFVFWNCHILGNRFQ